MKLDLKKLKEAFNESYNITVNHIPNSPAWKEMNITETFETMIEALEEAELIMTMQISFDGAIEAKRKEVNKWLTKYFGEGE